MSNQPNDGGPAFPRTGFELSDGSWVAPQGGMTLRDHFAGQALQGTIASMAGVSLYEGKQLVDSVGGPAAFQDKVACTCYDYADAMLKARNTEPQNQ